MTRYCADCGGPHRPHVLGRMRHAVRHARWAKPVSLTARLRMLWQDFVVHGLFGPGSEVCQDCGRTYLGTLWHAPTPLWVKLVGGDDGTLCPACFGRRAEVAGLGPIVWFPTFGTAAWDEGQERMSDE